MTDLPLPTRRLRSFDAAVTAVDGDNRRVALDRTAFYPTGGGQPHDNGTLGGVAVTDVRREGELVWHPLDGGLPAAARPIVVSFLPRSDAMGDEGPIRTKISLVPDHVAVNKRIRLQVLDA